MKANNNKIIFSKIVAFVIPIMLFAAVFHPWHVSADNGDLKIDFKVENPLPKVDSLNGLIKSLLNLVVMIGIPIVTLAIIYVGFLFVLAQGNSEKLKAAKQALLTTLIGAALILGSWVLAQAINETVKQLGS